jgi:hypothetical protein
MNVRLEHANLCVRNIDAAIGFLQTAFPEFHVRADQAEPDGTRWVHIGTDETYIALNQADDERTPRWEPYSGQPGVNHLGFEVDDVAALSARMLAAGYEESTVPNNHPHRSSYNTSPACPPSATTTPCTGDIIWTSASAALPGTGPPSSIRQRRRRCRPEEAKAWLKLPRR